MPSATTYSASSTRSKFIRLNDFCLAEYIFYQYENNKENTNINQEPSECHLMSLDNNIANIHQVYHSNIDGQQDSQKESYITNNIRKYLAVPYNNNRYYKFDADNNIFLDPVDGKYFTEYYVGENSESTVPLYLDTIRFHFISGYQTNSHDAIVFGMKVKETEGRYNNFLSTWFTPENYSDLIIFNPHPIYIVDERYDRYVDYRVPSINYINNDYYRGNNSTALGSSLTDEGNGFADGSPLIITMDICDSTSTREDENNKYTFFDISEHFEASVTQFNDYDVIEATIGESSEGNFFEYGLKTSDGTSVTDWFNRLNGKDDKWTFIHQLNIYEYTRYNTEYQSNTVTAYQSDNFDTLSKFRPVLEHSSIDVSVTIDYMCRIVNDSTGEQIIRTTSVTSYNVNSYGKNTLGISGLHGIAPYKIYNRLFKTNLSQSELYDEPSLDYNDQYSPEYGDVYTTRVQYPVYIDRNCVCANDDIVTSESISDNRIIYRQYDLWILLDTMDNVLRFTIYKNVNGSFVPYDLTDNSAGIYYKLVFNIDNSLTMSIDTATTESYNLADGEIIFELSSNEAKQVLESSTNDFYISAYNYSTMKNYPIYKGFWIPSSKYEDYKAHVDNIREEYGVLSENSKKLDEISENISSPLDDIPGDVYVPGYVDASTQDDMSVARSSTPNQN